MAAFLKVLPFILAAGWLYWVFTADTRTARTLRSNSAPLSDWAILEKVRGFEQALDVRGLEVRLLDMPQINAVASPSGEVYVSKGLYEAYLSGALRRSEVIAVIAHELGHVALGHVQRRMDQIRVETAGLAAAGFLVGRMLFGWLGLLAAILLPLLRNSLSRRDEFEADAFGVELLRRSGQDPNALVRALQKTEKLSGASNRPKPAKWLMSHPPTEERIAALQERIKAMPKPAEDGAA